MDQNLTNKYNSSKNLIQGNEARKNLFEPRLNIRNNNRSKMNSARTNKIYSIGGNLENQTSEQNFAYDPNFYVVKREREATARQKFPEMLESNIMLTDPQYMRLLSAKNSSTRLSEKRSMPLSVSAAITVSLN